MTQIRPRDSRLTFNQPKPIAWPSGIEWMTGTKPPKPMVETFMVSSAWDGTMAMWRVPEPETKTRIPTADKPRMWQENGLWHCQRDLVRGTGTTRRHAYRELLWRHALHALKLSGVLERSN